MLNRSEQKKAGIRPLLRVSKLAMKGLRMYAFSSIRIEGSDNLHQIINGIKSGTPTIFYPNHLSNVDGAAVDKALENQGVLPVFLAGLKITGNPLSRAVPTIPVWPPSIEAKTEKEKRRREKVNRQTVSAVQAALIHGHPIIIFPEATRSRSGSLQEGKSKIVERYNDLVPQTVVVPVSIKGTRRILPPGSILLRRGPVVLSFGKPLNAAELKQEAQQLDPINWAQIVMGRIMTEIKTMQDFQ